MNNFNLTKILISTSLLICSFLGITVNYAQESTEQFIPIGMSPGISNKYSYIGNIVSINRANKTFTVQSNRGIKTITVTPLTRFWIDRSKIKQTNLEASFNDCEKGNKVEVMHERDDDHIADWVKIEG